MRNFSKRKFIEDSPERADKRVKFRKISENETMKG